MWKMKQYCRLFSEYQIITRRCASNQIFTNNGDYNQLERIVFFDNFVKGLNVAKISSNQNEELNLLLTQNYQCVIFFKKKKFIE